MVTIYDIEEKDKTIEQQQEIIDRQRNALQLLLNAIWIHINAPDDNGEQLQDAYRLVTSGNDEGILSIVAGTKQELDAIIERQRAIIEKYNDAVGEVIDRLEFIRLDDGELATGLLLYLEPAYRTAQNTTTMTGTTEE